MLILASGSKRRIELLKDSGIEFKVVLSDIEEVIDPKLKLEEVATSLAREKAYNVFLKNQEDVVIAADTIVVLDDEILGKPIDEEDAYKMLKKLEGKTHEVITGVAIISKDQEEVFYKKSFVTMKELSDLQIQEYIKTGEPMDKAGSYGIQGLGKKLIESYQGDFFTIMGLPLTDVLKKLKKFNY